MPKSASSTSYRSSLRWTATEARAALAQLASSGMSVRAFAEREGLDPQRPYGWRRKLEAGHATRAPFVEIRGLGASGRVEFVLRSGIVMRVAESIEPQTLRALVEALDAVQAPTC